MSKILCRRLVQTICTPPVNTELPGCAPCLAARLVIFYEEENIDVLYIIISRIISLSLDESLFDLYHLIIIREAERSSI